MKFAIQYNTAYGECIKLRLLPAKSDLRTPAKYSFLVTVREMDWNEGNVWTTEIVTPSKGCDYEYLLCRGDEVLRVENARHHIAPGCKDKERFDSWRDKTGISYRDSVFGPYGSRAAGVAVPVFGLRSRASFGVGEFNDLRLLVDFCVKCGLKCIQLLPINDTTRNMDWSDSYPYNACSSFALHPQFINLEDAGVRVDKDFNSLKNGLNALKTIDYEKVNRSKDALLRKTFAEKGLTELNSADFSKFEKKNAFWLETYACFRALSAEFGTADPTQWGEYSKFSKTRLKAYVSQHSDEVAYHKWVQFVLDRQLGATVAYARSKGVHFKGDLPIGVSRNSADVWEYPDLFNLDSSAGAPPDYFSADGQNWGFPTYNWDAMERSDFKWWKARLAKMSEYFDAYRIDHVLGFFRIWEIPFVHGDKRGLDVSGMYGHFNPQLPYSSDQIAYFNDSDGGHPLFLSDPRHDGMFQPLIGARSMEAYASMSQEKKNAFDFLYDDFFFHRHDSFWAEGARVKLAALTENSEMLPCGEDLGMIPDCVPGVMAEYGILSLELPRMPKGTGREFGCAALYPYESVCTTSTHDMSPMRLWWNNCPGQAAHYYNEILCRSSEVPADPDPDVCTAIVNDVMKCPSMLCIIPLQDYLACSDTLRIAREDLSLEQINDPADPHRKWCYRMNVSLEGMLSDKSFCRHIACLVEESHR